MYLKIEYSYDRGGWGGYNDVVYGIGRGDVKERDEKE